MLFKQKKAIEISEKIAEKSEQEIAIDARKKMFKETLADIKSTYEKVKIPGIEKYLRGAYGDEKYYEIKEQVSQMQYIYGSKICHTVHESKLADESQWKLAYAGMSGSWYPGQGFYTSEITYKASELSKSLEHLTESKAALRGISQAMLKHVADKEIEKDTKRYLLQGVFCSIVAGAFESQATQYQLKKIAEKKPELIPEIEMLAKQYYHK